MTPKMELWLAHLQEKRFNKALEGFVIPYLTLRGHKVKDITSELIVKFLEEYPDIREFRDSLILRDHNRVCNR